jgi:signal transduction histidine kinase
MGSQTGSRGQTEEQSRLRQAVLPLIQFGVTAPTVAFLLVSQLNSSGPFETRKFLFWTVVVAAVELLPVPAWRGLRISVAFPVLIATSVLYTPSFAGLIAFVGSFDPREFKGEISLPRTLFNRSQITLAVITVGSVVRAMATVKSESFLLLGCTVLGVAAGYCVNVVLVTVHASVEYRVHPLTVLSRLRIGDLAEFLVSYVGLGAFGAILAQLYSKAGPWTVATVVAPLLFARQMFFRSMALEEATNGLRDRQLVLRALSNRMAEERQDERAQIAAYLHDDLAQSLFQLTLRLEMAKKRLGLGDLEAVSKDLDDISTIKEKTSIMVRGLVRDLHRSPIGRTGLGDAIQSFADESSRDSPVQVAVDVVEVTLPPAIQLLIYQIAREAMMNAMRHAEPENIMI